MNDNRNKSNSKSFDSDAKLPLFENAKEEKKKADSTLKPKTTVNNKNSVPPLSLGPYLQEARVKAGYSISQVAMATKLNIHYIEALERDDYKHTPPYIYMKAYVKKLCSVYSIDEEKALSLLKPLDSAEANVPDTLMQDLHQTKQTNKEDEKKIKFIAKITLIVFSIVIVLCIILGFCFWPSEDTGAANKPLTSVEKAQTAKNMEQLIAPQSISLTKLPIK